MNTQAYSAPSLVVSITSIKRLLASRRHLKVLTPHVLFHRGFVQELAVHTVGGVIGLGETIMPIVPEQDRLVVDAMVAPASIDDVKPGQPVSIRFPAFDAATTPECKGTVQRVSADLIKDSQRQISYFLARMTLTDQDTCLRDTRRLQPGMPAEVHIQTGERNVLSYVMKPLSDQMSRAFRQ